MYKAYGFSCNDLLDFEIHDIQQLLLKLWQRRKIAVQLDDDPTFPDPITISSRLNSPHSVSQWRSAQAPDSAAQPGVQSGGGGGIQRVLVQPEGLKHRNLAHSRHQPVDSTAGPRETVWVEVEGLKLAQQWDGGRQGIDPRVTYPVVPAGTARWVRPLTAICPWQDCCGHRATAFGQAISTKAQVLPK